jgi:hypothetical protein
MTTVVASVDLGCMVADQRVTGEGPIAHISKIVRVRGNLYGLAGEIMPAFLFMEWLQNPKRKREQLHKMIEADSRSNFTILELSESGLALMDGWGAKVPLLDESYGIGTGAAVALSHMRKGMKPWDAVKASPDLDECSGLFGEPQTEFLIPVELGG